MLKSVALEITLSPCFYIFFFILKGGGCNKPARINYFKFYQSGFWSNMVKSEKIIFKVLNILNSGPENGRKRSLSRGEKVSLKNKWYFEFNQKSEKMWLIKSKWIIWNMVTVSTKNIFIYITLIMFLIDFET